MLYRAEHVAVVGERDRAHAERLRPGDQVFDPERAVEQRVLRVDVEMDELSCHAGDLKAFGPARQGWELNGPLYGPGMALMVGAAGR